MLGLAVAAFVFNVAGPPLMRLAREDQGAYDDLMLLLAPPIIGVVLGEIGAMACWLVWWEGPFLKRLAMHWLIAAALAISLAVGMVIFLVELFNDSGWKLIVSEMFGVPACVLPVVSLGVQLPLWPHRIYFGWRVVLKQSAEVATGSPPLSILDTLAGTGVVAVSLALIRAMPMPHSEIVWIQMAGSALFSSIASFLLLVPAMFFVLRMSVPIFGIGLCFGYMLTLTVLVMLSMLGRAPAPEAVFAILWGSFAFMATLAAPLFVWRACGYRLVSAKDRRSWG
jgi:hypothetical protein